jgi:hypothetical protein
VNSSPAVIAAYAVELADALFHANEHLPFSCSTNNTGGVKVNDQMYAAVICNGDSVPGQQSCGQVPLSEQEYERQLSKPNSLWCCPHRGSTAEFDDELFEDLHNKTSVSP